MNRGDLADKFAGVGVELGVAAGEYSDRILQNDRVNRLYSVDRWSDHHDDREHAKACRLLARHGTRSVVFRLTFDEALGLIGDESLDFIYIDGYAHEGQEGGKTLRDWWSKLKRGGVFAGHDYCARYMPTMDAVNQFAREHGLLVSVTDEPLASWYTRKP